MKPRIVSFHCVLKNSLGKVIGSTFNQDVITVSQNPNAPLKALAENLQDLEQGESRRVCLSAADAYGFYDLGKVITRTRDDFPGGLILTVGEQVLLLNASGVHQPYRVAEIAGDMIRLDGNHPLAGQDLVFEIEAVEARDASPDEIRESMDPAPAPTELKQWH